MTRPVAYAAAGCVSAGRVVRRAAGASTVRMPTVKIAGDANTMTDAITSAQRAPGPWAMTPPRAFPAAAAAP